ncbi:hypothetical protein AQUCO_00201435v1 [Aquilegia coerulea]|uniref:Uncharacterized protein n=1 Tax=Aquilegia coerulea TaxID=218851 RepID=A0A2G5F890_AQUCA|nr:hypothetical protein AQUCO_00201435v1 [Aquilegia coerulea]
MTHVVEGGVLLGTLLLVVIFLSRFQESSKMLVLLLSGLWKNRPNWKKALSSRYANEPNVMRYVKIAASLRDKAVRDVALRCRWMTNESGKRRKQEHYSGRKMKDKRETLLESSLKANTTPVQPHNMATYSLMMHHMDPNNTLSSEAVSNTTRHLLDENVKVFGQITSNFSTYKIQDNIDLLCRTRKNIADILKEMREVPGIMSQMPPLPVSINEELADAFLPSTYQAIFGLPREIHLKQEPRC